ncbi:MAG: ISNCY family transposase [Cyclobacteriaceae bacterium]|nr:ISNCY family transposase [Cyclobacteriaceae bacterium]
MRKRFEQQLQIGQLLIEDTEINVKDKSALNQLLAALKEIYCTPKYNKKVLDIFEGFIMEGKAKTGRNGMDLWTIFVLSQIRFCLKSSYEVVHNMVNNHRTLRQIMGIEKEVGHERETFSYQRIYDNLSLVNDDLIKEVNDQIVSFGYERFKKKETTALHLKTDSYTVESNVHFPTDYGLLYDCVKKVLSLINIFKRKKIIGGWRKLANWKSTIKALVRQVGRCSMSRGKNKKEKLKTAAENLLDKVGLLVEKLENSIGLLELEDPKDEKRKTDLIYYLGLLIKHIDLVNRRLVRGEEISHKEKMFSIHERYTEWINKGKRRPSVELGKTLSITTDQYGLIVDYYIHDKEQDREVVKPIVDTVSSKIEGINSWSFDKGYWNKSNKEYVQNHVKEIIMPKLGKLTQSEKEEQQRKSYVKLKNKHSAVESNINELEQRGLDRCPDRGFENFKRYVSLGVCAYNLKKIGKRLIEIEEQKSRVTQRRHVA